MTASATALREGIDNRPSKCAYHLLHVLVEQLLDPIREAWGGSIIVTSGYRCKQLNELVGGTKYSHHILGCAADIIGGLPLYPQAELLEEDKSSFVANAKRSASPRIDAHHASARRGGTTESAENQSDSPKVRANRQLFDLIVKMHEEGRIKFTQLILEGDGRWIHISYVPSDLRCQVIGNS